MNYLFNNLADISLELENSTQQILKAVNNANAQRNDKTNNCKK